MSKSDNILINQNMIVEKLTKKNCKSLTNRKNIEIENTSNIFTITHIISECKQNNIDYCIFHIHQYHFYEMGSIFFKEMKLLEAKYNLDVGSGN